MEINKKASKKEVVYTGKISDEQFELLKRKHGDVYTMEVPLNDKGTEMAVCYLSKPDRLTLGAVLHKEKTNSIAAKEMLLNATWLEGDQRIKNDDDVFYSACTALEKFFAVREASLKKN
jgi:hypothetical protein